jgi:hypothetical protein
VDGNSVLPAFCVEVEVRGEDLKDDIISESVLVFTLLRRALGIQTTRETDLSCASTKMPK